MIPRVLWYRSSLVLPIPRVNHVIYRQNISIQLTTFAPNTSLKLKCKNDPCIYNHGRPIYINEKFCIFARLYLIFVLFVLLHLNRFISLYQNGCFLFIFCQFIAEVTLNNITAFFFKILAALDRPMLKVCEYRGTLGTAFSRTRQCNITCQLKCNNLDRARGLSYTC
jgi:hypothetical protein